MPNQPLTMHQIRELLRMHAAQLSQPQIARALGLSLGVVNKYVQAARRATLSWPLPDELTDAQLRQRLFPDQKSAPRSPKSRPTSPPFGRNVNEHALCSAEHNACYVQFGIM